MKRAKKTARRRPIEREPEHTYATVRADYIEGILADIDAALLQGMATYGMHRTGVPCFDLPNMADVVGDISLKLFRLRFELRNGVKDYAESEAAK